MTDLSEVARMTEADEQLCRTSAAAQVKYLVTKKVTSCSERGFDPGNRDRLGLNVGSSHQLATFVRKIGCDPNEFDRCVTCQFKPGDKTIAKSNQRVCANSAFLPNMTDSDVEMMTMSTLIGTHANYMNRCYYYGVKCCHEKHCDNHGCMSLAYLDTVDPPWANKIRSGSMTIILSSALRDHPEELRAIIVADNLKHGANVVVHSIEYINRMQQICSAEYQLGGKVAMESVLKKFIRTVDVDMIDDALDFYSFAIRYGGSTMMGELEGFRMHFNLDAKREIESSFYGKAAALPVELEFVVGSFIKGQLSCPSEYMRKQICTLFTMSDLEQCLPGKKNSSDAKKCNDMLKRFRQVYQQELSAASNEDTTHVLTKLDSLASRKLANKKCKLNSFDDIAVETRAYLQDKLGSTVTVPQWVPDVSVAAASSLQLVPQGALVTKSQELSPVVFVAGCARQDFRLEDAGFVVDRRFTFKEDYETVKTGSSCSLSKYLVNTDGETGCVEVLLTETKETLRIPWDKVEQVLQIYEAPKVEYFIEQGDNIKPFDPFPNENVMRLCMAMRQLEEKCKIFVDKVHVRSLANFSFAVFGQCLNITDLRFLRRYLILSWRPHTPEVSRMPSQESSSGHRAPRRSVNKNTNAARVDHAHLHTHLHKTTTYPKKLSLHDDQDVDTSKMKLRDSSSIANVFAYDTNMDSPPYHVEDYYWEDGTFRKIAISHQFQNLTMAVVVSNAIWLSVETGNESESLFSSAWYYVAAANFFGIYFTLELVIRFMAFKNKLDCLRDGWFRFDLFLVITMILDIWVFQVITALTAEGSEGGVRIPTQPLRMLRLFKLSRMARLMSAFPELVIMIKGTIQATRAVLSSLVLVGIMVYAWAILIHSLVGGDDNLNSNLNNRVGYSLANMTDCVWTLIMTGTFMLDNTAPLLTTLLFSNDILYIFVGFAFLAFQYFSCLLVLQMLIGVVTDVIRQVQQASRDAETIAYIKQELVGDYVKVQSADGKIGKANLMQILSCDNSKSLFKTLNINRLFLMNMVALLFPTDDTEVSTKAILDLMVMCTSTNQASVQILSHVLAFLSGEIGDLHAYTVHHLHELTGYLAGDEIYGRLPGETHSFVSQAMNEEFE